MRVIFAGTPEFARVALEALIEADHSIALVLTRPDQAAGRGQRLQASPVKQAALAAGLSVYQPRTLRDEAAQRVIAQVDADVMVVAAYGLILPAAVLQAPRLGCLNIHASLLPRWRGAAPIQRAIAAGDTQTGITIMQMDEGLDTGAMLRRDVLSIDPSDSAGDVHDRLARLGGRSIVEALADLAAGRLTPTPQPEEGVTYAAKLDKAEGVLDWRLTARELVDRIRAFDPFPGSQSCCRDAAYPDGLPLKIWQARVVDASALAAAGIVEVGPPGRTLRLREGDWWVACGDGAIALSVIQKPGARRLSVVQALPGLKLSECCQFDAHPSTATQ